MQSCKCCSAVPSASQTELHHHSFLKQLTWSFSLQMPRLPSPDRWKFRCFYFVYISQEFSRKWETESKQEWFAAFTSCLSPSSLHVTCWFLSTPFTYHSRVAGDQPMPALTVGRCCCFDSCASTSIYMCTTKTHHANISRVNAEYACKLYHCVFKQ